MVDISLGQAKLIVEFDFDDRGNSAGNTVDLTGPVYDFATYALRYLMSGFVCFGTEHELSEFNAVHTCSVANQEIGTFVIVQFSERKVIPRGTKKFEISPFG